MAEPAAIGLSGSRGSTLEVLPGLLMALEWPVGRWAAALHQQYVHVSAQDARLMLHKSIR